jgi:hypothetical protein
VKSKRRPPEIGGSYQPGHPLLELTRARLIEFFREPSALFWVFVFPVLLTIGLGIAFRDDAGEVHRVALVGAPAVAIAPHFADGGVVDAREYEASAARDALRGGRVDLELRIDSPPAVEGQGRASPHAGATATTRPIRAAAPRARPSTTGCSARWAGRMSRRSPRRGSPSRARATSTSWCRGSWASTS